MYHALTGRQPPSAGDLFSGAKLVPISSDVSESLRSGIEQGLKPNIFERPQTAKALEQIINVATRAKSEVSPEKPIDDSLERLIYGSGLKVMTDHHFIGLGTKFYTSKKLVEFTKARIIPESENVSSYFLVPLVIASFFIFLIMNPKEIILHVNQLTDIIKLTGMIIIALFCFIFIGLISYFLSNLYNKFSKFTL